jgi:nucleotide-binding universal stress UspA family protein
MFHNIMVPLDGSHFSALALPFALRLAQKEAARVHLVRVHVPAAPTSEVIVTANYDELLRENERYWLDTETDQVRTAGVSVQSQLLEGPVVEGLQRYVQASSIDLVIMTTHGRAGLRQFLLGSVAKDLIRKIYVPILLIRPKNDNQIVPTDVADVRRILLTLDGSPECEAALPYASGLAKITGAELLLVRVAVPTVDAVMSAASEALEDYMNTAVRDNRICLQNIANTVPDGIAVRMAALRGHDIATSIVECASTENVDVIVMATHAREGWSRVAYGSVAEAVLRKSAAPLLLLRAPQVTREHCPVTQELVTHSG